MRQRRSGAAERAAVLEELVRRHEGLSAGVKEVLQRAADPADPVFRNVCGLVADLFHVSVEAAPLVEIALGQTAQHVVAARSAELLDYSADRIEPARRPRGLRLARRADKRSGHSRQRPDLRADPTSKGGPACSAGPTGSSRREPRFAPLAERLLGRTWFVEKLAHALALARSVGAGLSLRHPCRRTARTRRHADRRAAERRRPA